MSKERNYRMKNVTIYLTDKKHEQLRRHTLKDAMKTGKTASMSRVINSAIDSLLKQDNKSEISHPNNEEIWQSQTELRLVTPDKKESKPDSEQKSELGKYAFMLDDL